MINYVAYAMFIAYVVLVFIVVYLVFFTRGGGLRRVFLLMGLGVMMLFILVSLRPVFLVAVEGFVESSVEVVDQSGAKFVNSTVVPRYVPTPHGDYMFTACLMCVLVVFMLAMYSAFDTVVKWFGWGR